MSTVTTNHNEISEEELIDIALKRKCYAGPISANIKCIVFTILFAAFYWYAPKKNKYILIGCLYFPYLFLAYYDDYYNCKRNKFGPTFLQHFYEVFKPKTSVQSIIYGNMCDRQRLLIRTVDVIILIAIIALIPVFVKWNPK